jgi:hypothetical protein
MLERAERASHIDRPASSYAIMRRARPYRGENPEPGKDVHGELDPTPGIREHPGSKVPDWSCQRHVRSTSNFRHGDAAHNRRLVPLAAVSWCSKALSIDHLVRAAASPVVWNRPRRFAQRRHARTWRPPSFPSWRALSSKPDCHHG